MTTAEPQPSDHQRCIVGVLSCQAYLDRMAACEATWVPRLERAGIEVVFLVGNPLLVFESRLVGRTLELHCGDTYEDLPDKTQRFCRWALQHRSFDHLFKCDDDTHIDADAFVDFEAGESDYLGAPMPGGYASGGCGYFLTPDAARIVALEPLGHWAEDRAVGELLAAHGIELTASDQFRNCDPGWDGQPFDRAITHHLQRLPADAMLDFDARILAQRNRR